MSEAYTLSSDFSGAAQKGVIGIYNGGGAPAKSGVSAALLRIELGLTTPDSLVRFDIITISGNMTGSAGKIARFDSSGTISAMSGYIDGAITISGIGQAGEFPSIIVAPLQPLNGSIGTVPTFIYNYETALGKRPLIRSGQGMYVQLTSGRGVGSLAFVWVEAFL